MTPQERLSKTIQAESSRSSSAFEDFSHRGSIKRAIVEFGDFRKAGKTDLGDVTIQDEISFLDVKATFVSVGDKITYNSIDYNIDYFSPTINGFFKIFATKVTRTGSK